MFLLFNKFTNTAVSSELVINAFELLTIDFNNYENGSNVIYNATHVEVGNPKYQFYTPSTLASIELALNVIDISGGFVPGPPCSGGHSSTIIAPQSQFPLMEVQIINNNTVSEWRRLILNPTKILYSENVTFIDASSGAQTTATLIVMNDINRTTFRTTLPWADLKSILQPVIVA